MPAGPMALPMAAAVPFPVMAFSMAAAVSFPMMSLAVVAALRIRVKGEPSLSQSLGRLIRVPGHSAVQMDACLGQCLARASSDAAAD